MQPSMPDRDEAWIAACFTKPAARTPAMAAVLAPSDELIGEIESADMIVIGTPMYNYGMPARLKAWVDQVVRVDRTFSFDLARGDWPLAPILSGKALILLTSSGEFGFGADGMRTDMNHLDPHLRVVGRYLGVTPLRPQRRDSRRNGFSTVSVPNFWPCCRGSRRSGLSR